MLPSADGTPVVAADEAVPTSAGAGMGAGEIPPGIVMPSAAGSVSDVQDSQKCAPHGAHSNVGLPMDPQMKHLRGRLATRAGCWQPGQERGKPAATTGPFSWKAQGGVPEGGAWWCGGHDGAMML